MTFDESMVDTCKHKLNKSIIPFEQDKDLFFKYVDWHTKTTGGVCTWIWTPLIKLDSEGLVLNKNDNIETSVQNWAKGQPNGGKYENFVVIVAAQMALADSEPYWSSCSSCRISNMLLLQMDGLCTDSFIGNVRESYLRVLQVLISDKKFKILNTQSSIGFNGWKSMNIRLCEQFYIFKDAIFLKKNGWSAYYRVLPFGAIL